MQIKKLWVLPIMSSELEKGVNFVNNGIDVILSFEYLDSKKIQKNVELEFESVLCHLHTSERFTKAMLDAYETLVQVNESDWLNELRQLNSRDFNFWKPKHFAIYFDGIGMYQFIARNYAIIEKVSE